jgi:hypothetical protein
MLGFLVDNIYVVFGDQIFQQSVGIPMGTKVRVSLIFTVDYFIYLIYALILTADFSVYLA